jgi:DNA adenine methylase
MAPIDPVAPWVAWPVGARCVHRPVYALHGRTAGARTSGLREAHALCNQHAVDHAVADNRHLLAAAQVGGGAVLFDILNKYELDEIYISDINSELILTYKNIRDHIDELILALHTLQDEYFALDICKRNSYYYDKRERFNLLKKIKSESVELAALFIFLNRTCFNGLYRVNSKGEFNVPMGSYKNPTICEEANVRAVSEKLQMVNIVCGDYKKSRQFIDSRTFAYFDPPYRPLSSTSSFTSYAQGGFDDKQQAELAQFIDEVSEKGAAVVASNSDPKNTDENDDFFDRLYAKHNIHRISAMRMINSVGEGRGKISELLITTY